VAATFGFGSTSKIRDVHVNRLAMIYVRQSTPQQVLENRESRERQYALGEFAQRLGWPAERVVLIDEDQGQSGKTATDRSGFQRLMTEVSLNHVGVVLGLELSRLSRSNKDWHQLIDVCFTAETRIAFPPRRHACSPERVSASRNAWWILSIKEGSLDCPFSPACPCGTVGRKRTIRNK